MVPQSTSSTEGMVSPIEIALQSKLVEFPLGVTYPRGSEDSVSSTVGGPGAAHAVNRKINATIRLKSIFHLTPPLIIESLHGGYGATTNHFFWFHFVNL
jgi:hypothetical protein